MKLLQELHNLHEAELPHDNRIEIIDLIKHFPNNYKKAISKLWDNGRLTYRGIPFQSDGADVFSLADKAVKEWGKDGQIPLEFSVVEGEIDGEHYTIELNYDEPIDPTEHGQEVYMGYDIQDDKIYVGYDVTHSEEFFNNEWDEAFEKEVGVPFDLDDKEHYALFTKAFKEFKSEASNMVFSLTFQNGEFTAHEEYSGKGLFYPNGKRWVEDKGLLDLRLD